VARRLHVTWNNLHSGLVSLTRTICVSRGEVAGDTLLGATGPVVWGAMWAGRWKRIPVRSELSGDVITGVRLLPPAPPYLPATPCYRPRPWLLELLRQRGASPRGRSVDAPNKPEGEGLATGRRPRGSVESSGRGDPGANKGGSGLLRGAQPALQQPLIDPPTMVLRHTPGIGSVDRHG
jgi:hypothetical protein